MPRGSFAGSIAASIAVSAGRNTTSFMLVMYAESVIFILNPSPSS